MQDGVTEQPVDGISMTYTFNDPTAPERHKIQYYEMHGNRSLYSDGWVAAQQRFESHFNWVCSMEFD
jgi:arylsulfatase A-like enzyme